MSAMAEAKASGRRNPGKVAIPEKKALLDTLDVI